MLIIRAIIGDRTIHVFSAASLLFVPGSRPDRFAKAKAAGAGLTIIDLEDAVPAGEKEAARKTAFEHLASESMDGWALRINAVTTADGIRDLAALTTNDTLPPFLLVPMVESPVELEILSNSLGNRCPALIPLIETPKGLRHAHEIACASGVAAMMFGGGDFSAELGVELSWEPLLTARQQFILACSEHAMPAIDVPYVQLDNEAGLIEECARAEAIGFDAKAAIHPRQVPAIEAAFEPGDEAVNAAQQALQAYEDAGERAIRYDGRMLEAPLVKKYRAIVARKEGKQNA
ncbi:CoA ester lyase [uncultured Erythrobacter sp.]|uniref:HpcH/HpaI aldolase/citrate lyase family protein n=1 Tax=uncultured Erythrobacter sp. TaxID=263913 RepID=UPI002617D5A1|nr:CoA ester lyase [uncultured Erythrobacter sp.]